MHQPGPPAESASVSLLGAEAVLFDLDGVLTPTAELHERAWRETFEYVLARIAPPGEDSYRSDDYLLHIDGRPRFEGVAAVLESHRVTLPWGTKSDEPGLESVAAIGNMKNQTFQSILERGGIEPYLGSVKVINVLADHGIPMAIVSSSQNASKVLEFAGFAETFAVVVDGNSIAALGLAGKPAPDPFLEAARQLGASPKRSVVIEDAVAGVEAGRAGGFGLIVGVARTGEGRLLEQAGANVVVRDLEELL